MNTETTNILTSNIADLMNWVKLAATAVSQFAQEQTPLYIQELLRFNFVDTVIFAIVFGVVAGLLVHFWKQVWNVLEDRGLDHLMIFYALVLFVITCMSLGNAEQALKIKLAPRVYIVDYIAQHLTPSTK